MTETTDTNVMLKPILQALLQLLEVSELQARKEQSNHITQLRAIESALENGHSIDIEKTMNTFSNVVTAVADNTATLIKVNNELVQSHKEQKESIDKLITTVEEHTSRMNALTLSITATLIKINNEFVQSHKEQKESVDKLITTFEEYASRMDTLALAIRQHTKDTGLDAIFNQLVVENTSD